MAGLPLMAQIVLTIVLVAAGAYCLHRCVSPRRPLGGLDRVGYGAHAAMAASMTAMLWRPPLAVASQMTFFAVAGGWFAVLATGSVPRPLRLVAAGREGHAVGMGGRVRCAHHAVVMALMVWMFSAVPAAASMAGMPGMPTSAGGATASARPLAGVGAVYCLAAAIILATTAALPRAHRTLVPHTDRRDDAMHAAMTAAMAAILLTLA